MSVDLDHVALATRDAGPAVRTLAGELGGLVLFGGQSTGFRPMQILLGDARGGMRIELLEPWAIETNDFLERFLLRHGDGPHHLTFKVDDLDEMLERLRTAGYSPVNVDRSDPTWQEAFLLPREAHGTVVQVAQTVHEFPTEAAFLEHVRRHGASGHPKWWADPPQAAEHSAVLHRVVMRTPSLDAALGFFAGVLGGTVEGDHRDHADLVWPRGARIRLEVNPSAAPGIDRLEGELAGKESPTEVDVAGTRLLLAGA